MKCKKIAKLETEKLFSLPMLIGPTEFNMDDEEENKNLANKLLKDSRIRTLDNIDSHATLYRTGNTIFLYHKKAEKIIFCLTFKITSYRKHIGRVLQTRGLWSSRLYRQTEGLTRKVFFEYLLPETGTVITDSEQTDLGARYWGQKIAEALRMNKHVNYIDFNTNKVKKIQSIEDLENILKTDKPWGRSEKYKARRFLISEKPLII